MFSSVGTPLNGLSITYFKAFTIFTGKIHSAHVMWVIKENLRRSQLESRDQKLWRCLLGVLLSSASGEITEYLSGLCLPTFLFPGDVSYKKHPRQRWICFCSCFWVLWRQIGWFCLTRQGLALSCHGGRGASLWNTFNMSWLQVDNALSTIMMTIKSIRIQALTE